MKVGGMDIIRADHKVTMFMKYLNQQVDNMEGGCMNMPGYECS